MSLLDWFRKSEPEVRFETHPIEINQNDGKTIRNLRRIATCFRLLQENPHIDRQKSAREEIKRRQQALSSKGITPPESLTEALNMLKEIDNGS